MPKRFQLLTRNTPHIPRENGLHNINGPSLIEVPDWISHRLGRYYLYFAHHEGQVIRLAYSDNLFGNWRVYETGTLRLEQTPCIGHIASPDILISPDSQEIHMYFHGPVIPKNDSLSDLSKQHPILGNQRTFLAKSRDGIHFTMEREQPLGSSYFRVWKWQKYHYAIAMPGIMYRSEDNGKSFVAGKQLFSENFRHSAVALDDDVLNVYYSQAGDRPERILLSKIRLNDDWINWIPSAPIEILRPAESWEGVNEPLVPSQRGLAPEPVHQLRDPAVYDEDGIRYLLYSFAGEQGIGLTIVD